MSVHCSSFTTRGTPHTAIYTLSLHDALPISDHHRVRLADEVGLSSGGRGDHRRHCPGRRQRTLQGGPGHVRVGGDEPGPVDRKSTRLNSSQVAISYAVFCWKKKKRKKLRSIT